MKVHGRGFCSNVCFPAGILGLLQRVAPTEASQVSDGLGNMSSGAEYINSGGLVFGPVKQFTLVCSGKRGGEERGIPATPVHRKFGSQHKSPTHPRGEEANKGCTPPHKAQYATEQACAKLRMHLQ